MTPRFEVRYGKFGAYFYDNVNDVDLTLEQVLEILNS